MQQEKYTFLDFERRTDALAAALGVGLNALPARLGMSRAMLFNYRSNKSPISSKGWAKLVRAEREAGIVLPESIVVREEHPGVYGQVFSGETPQQIAEFLRNQADHHSELACKFNAAAELLDPRKK